MTKSSQSKGPGDDGRLLTVAHVRGTGREVEVMFLESARIYRLASTGADPDVLLSKLLACQRSGRPVRVRFDAPAGDLILAVEDDCRGN
ncbi:MAG: hypothetical protein U1F36_23675 [Planctomycetota bacterium]